MSHQDHTAVDTTAEIEAFVEQAERRRKAIKACVESLRTTWMEVTGDNVAPTAPVITYLLTLYHPDLVERAFIITANKVMLGTVDTDGPGWYHYLLGVLRNISKPSSPQPLLTENDIDEEGGEVA